VGKKGRHGRHGKSRSKHKPSRTAQQSRGRYTPRPVHDEPDILRGVRRALSSGAPLDMLAQGAMLLSVVDPRSSSPLERARGEDAELPNRDDLVASFIDVDVRETSTLLAVIAEMCGDELLRARIRRELASRSHSLPAWLMRLGEIEAYRAVEMTHTLRDGDNVIVGARLPTGHELSVVVYIDYNLGTVAKDAFVVEEPIGELLTFMRSKVDNPDTNFNDIDLADARARITEAIDTGAIMFPPFETDTWPACRPLVEWITRLLPEGGTGFERSEWSEDARQQLAEQFFASPFGSGLDDPDHRGLLNSLFGCDYGAGDPLHWSPTRVEIVLSDWIPRKIVADVAYLSQAPELLRAFIRFCHSERGIRPELTDETIAQVDEWEPEYQEIIRSPRPQGPAALLAAIGALDPDGPWDSPLEDEREYHDIMLDTLRDAVGSDETLEHLDDQALPDEPFTWNGIPTDIHDRVQEVLETSDRCCDELLDVEYRTACRRLLARVAAGDPNVFRRRARSDTAAAAICWIVGKTNDLFSPTGGGLLVRELDDYFGLAQGNASQRATTMLRAAGYETRRYGQIRLGTPDYLVSSRRRKIIELRDRYQAMGEAGANNDPQP